MGGLIGWSDEQAGCQMLGSINSLAQSTDSVAACLCGSLPPYRGGGEEVGHGEGQDVAQHDGRESYHPRAILRLCIYM